MGCRRNSNLSCNCTVWSRILYFTVLCYVHSIGACVHIVGLYLRVPPPVEMGSSSQKQTWDIDILSGYFDQMDSSNLSCHCTVWSWILYFTVLCYVHSIGACVHIVGLYPRVPPPVEIGASSQKQTWDTDILYQTCLVVTCFQYPICARSWLIEATWWVPLYEPWVCYSRLG